MRSVYRVLAYLIAALVVVQAGAIAYGVFGLFSWVEGGGTFDQAAVEAENTAIGGGFGFGLHITIGYFVIPLAALLLLIISFFAKIPGGIRWALILFLTVVVQTLLAGFAREVAEIGWLHGMVALVLFGLAVTAGIRAGRQAPVAAEAADTSVA
jgi:Family of unknown function (DUF6220)